MRHFPILLAAFALAGSPANAVENHAETTGPTPVVTAADLVDEVSIEFDRFVLDNRLDAHFGDLPGWFADRHPNLAGYHVIGDETAKFLAPIIRAKFGKAQAKAANE